MQQAVGRAVTVVLDGVVGWQELDGDLVPHRALLTFASRQQTVEDIRRAQLSFRGTC